MNSETIPYPLSREELYGFIVKAGASTYAGGGKIEENSERKGFRELVYEEGDFYYRDSYTGYTRSRGMEVIRYKGDPIWSSLYGGGMVEGYESMADKTFEFLKQAMKSKTKDFMTLRGPKKLIDGDWKYSYKQEGDVFEFNGYEEIYHKGKLVFFHKVIGGIIINA